MYQSVSPINIIEFNEYINHVMLQRGRWRCLLPLACLRAFMGNSYGDFCGARPVKSPSAVFCRAGLVLTPQNVESSYQALAESNCIPRRWHVEGRWGIPIEQIKSGQHQGMRFIPLLYQAEQRLPKEVLALLDAGTACLIPQNSSNASKAGAWTDWHPGHQTDTPPRICQQTSTIAPPAFVFIFFFSFFVLF